MNKRNGGDGNYQSSPSTYQQQWGGRKKVDKGDQQEKHAKKGGYLIIVGSVLGIFSVLFAQILLGAFIEMYPVGLSLFCFIFPIIFGLIGITGGIMAVKKKKFKTAIGCGIVGIFSIGFGLGSILCLIGVILVGISKRDFENKREFDERFDQRTMKTPQQQTRQQPSRQQNSPQYSQPPSPNEQQRHQQSKQKQPAASHKPSSGDKPPTPKDLSTTQKEQKRYRTSLEIKKSISDLKEEEKMIDTRAIEKALKEGEDEKAGELLEELKEKYQGYKDTIEELEGLDEKESSLAEQLADEKINRSTYDDAVEKIEHKKADLEEKLNNLRQEVIHEDYEKPF